jgi:hypothetical protein
MYMAAVERDAIQMTSLHAEVANLSHYPNRETEELVEEIYRLRKAMTETFLQERSLTADSVMELSRQLDLKINEYMKQVLMNRK